MLNENKIRLMTNLARYEDGEGKEDLKISKYYRSDYIGMGLFKNFILTMLGYFLLWVLVVAYNLDYIMGNLTKMNIPVVIFEFVLGYIVVLIFYSIITYVKRSARYMKGKTSVQTYYADLEELSKTYGKEDQKKKEKKLLGGNHR